MIGTMSPENGELEFIAPPEAPVFEPTEEEFRDPLAYIAKIRPFAIRSGICKIRPPPDWQPSFSVDVEKFHFTPRIQRLNELEAKSRVKLNFLDAIAKFWELQGSTLKLPTVEKKPLDLYSLHKSVQEEGGYEDVVLKRKWSRVAQRMGYPPGKSIPSLRVHYEKILFPYDVFLSGAMTGDVPVEPPNVVPSTKQEQIDEDYMPSANSDSEPEGDAYVERKGQRKHRNQVLSQEEEIIDYTKNTELKKLRFLAPGPKMITPPVVKQEPKLEESNIVPTADVVPSENIGFEGKIESTKETQELTRRRTSRITKEKKMHYSIAFVDDYKCQVCDRGDSEESMLLCDNCDSSYHTFCLIPPLNSVPPGDWRCPKCVAQECKKPQEAYGFEQAKKLYNLREFGVMADRFKEDYFAMPPHEVPSAVVEKEFWRLVNSLDDEVVVEYGADLHTAEHGSGFPMDGNTSDPEDEEYIKSWWNLNNLPVHDKSVLRFISANISGMKVPWLYVGMCFSSFCWHNEDHWSYSINYLHWGEPKTWYGVPGDGAEKFESCMKETAPELFEAQPDLLHHLVTILSPITLINYGVPVVRTNQYAGEFVITFPRAYHAGFNQGYNCAEAVNFCPADWLEVGRHSIDHYRAMVRCPVFSHDELVCKMALEADTLDLELAKSVYAEMNTVTLKELKMRKELTDLGMVETLRVEFELLPDDERQCKICRTTCFLSGVVCHCNKDRLACLFHAKDMCSCLPARKSIRYRYKVTEMEGMVAQLKRRADVFDNWKKEVTSILDPSTTEKKDLSHLKDLVSVAVANKFPSCTSLDGLKTAIADAEQCSQVATQLFIKKHKTRNSQSQTCSQMPRVTLQELQDFIEQVSNLRCVIKESRLVQALLTKVKNYQYEAKCMLADPGYDIPKITELIEHGATLEVDLPEIGQLEQCLSTAKWLQQVEDCLKSKELVMLDVIRTLVDQGALCTIKPGLSKLFSSLKELLFVSDRWEEKAKLCLQAKPRHMAGTLEAIVQEASKVNVLLPHVNQLKDALKTTKEWTEKVEKIQNLEPYPDYDLLEALVLKGRPVPVRLDHLPQMESQIAAAKAWKDRTTRTFVKKGSTKALLELLLPRREVTRRFKDNLKAKKKRDKDEKERDKKEREKEREAALENIDFDRLLSASASPDRATVLADRKDKESTEVQGMKKIRAECRQVLRSENVDGPFCSCRKGVEGFMLRCQLCLEWFHGSCVPFPKSLQGKAISKTVSPVVVAKEFKYLCPFCCRSRRPRLETVLSLLMSLQKLPVRLPEGEALQYLTERAMNWQERAKLVLATTKIASLLTRIRLEGGAVEQEKNTRAGQSSTSTATYSAFIQKNLSIGKQDAVSDAAHVAVTTTIAEQQDHPMASDHDPLTLECNESMGGSPTATTSEKTAGNDSASTQASRQTPSSLQYDVSQSSRSASPIDVVAPSQGNALATSTNDARVCLADYLLDHLEELAMEGDMLEVTLDEAHQLWLILQDQRPMKHQDCRIMDPEYRKRLIKERKKKKRRNDSAHEKPHLTLTLPRPTKSEGQSDALPSPSKKRRKKDTAEKAGRTTVKVEQPDCMVVDVVANATAEKEDDDEDEACAVRDCMRPTGDEVGWVQCDECSSWFHVVCVGLTAAAADALDTYVCPPCESKTADNATIPSTHDDSSGTTVVAQSPEAADLLSTEEQASAASTPPCVPPTDDIEGSSDVAEQQPLNTATREEVPCAVVLAEVSTPNECSAAEPTDDDTQERTDVQREASPIPCGATAAVETDAIVVVEKSPTVSATVASPVASTSSSAFACDTSTLLSCMASSSAEVVQQWTDMSSAVIEQLRSCQSDSLTTHMSSTPDEGTTEAAAAAARDAICSTPSPALSPRSRPISIFCKLGLADTSESPRNTSSQISDTVNSNTADSH